MINYTSLEDIKQALKRKRLQKEIAAEQIKYKYHTLGMSFSKNLLISTGISLATKYGVRYLKTKIA